jgi:hypothetical protein
MGSSRCRDRDRGASRAQSGTFVPGALRLNFRSAGFTANLALTHTPRARGHSGARLSRKRRDKDEVAEALPKMSPRNPESDAAEGEETLAGLGPAIFIPMARTVKTQDCERERAEAGGPRHGGRRNTFLTVQDSSIWTGGANALRISALDRPAANARNGLDEWPEGRTSFQPQVEFEPRLRYVVL